MAIWLTVKVTTRILINITAAIVLSDNLTTGVDVMRYWETLIFFNFAITNIEVDYAAGGPAAAAVIGQQNGFETE
jgi:hypothetical protein